MNADPPRRLTVVDGGEQPRAPPFEGIVGRTPAFARCWNRRRELPPRRQRCSSPARAARARSWSHAPSTTEAGGRVLSSPSTARPCPRRTTGPCAGVRHPMYASGSLYMLGTPLTLGSCWGFLVLAGTLPFLLWRLLDEERILTKDLPGYAEYRRRVRHRLVPCVW